MKIVFNNSKNNLCIRRLDDINSPLHFHETDEIEIMIMLDGTSECVVSGKNYSLKTGDAIIITRYQPHSYHHTLKVDTISLIFSRSVFPESFSFFEENSLIEPIVNLKNSQSNIYDNIECFLKDLSENSIEELILKSYAQIIVSKIIKLAIRLNKRDTVFVPKTSFLEKAQRYCFKNFKNDLTVSQVAKEINVHPNYLSSMFKAHYGISLLRYINICRLQQACEMLEIKEKSITDISYACGFQSVRSFNRIFKEEIGCTPKEYQSKFKGNSVTALY